MFDVDPLNVPMNTPFPGFESACVGRLGKKLLYDSKKVVQILQERDGMSEEEAWEHLEYNLRRSYLALFTPRT